MSFSSRGYFSRKCSCTRSNQRAYVSKLDQDLPVTFAQTNIHDLFREVIAPSSVDLIVVRNVARRLLEGTRSPPRSSAFVKTFDASSTAMCTPTSCATESSP